jgi:hypothetical protein
MPLESFISRIKGEAESRVDVAEEPLRKGLRILCYARNPAGSRVLCVNGNPSRHHEKAIHCATDRNTFREAQRDRRET